MLPGPLPRCPRSSRCLRGCRVQEAHVGPGPSTSPLHAGHGRLPTLPNPLQVLLSAKMWCDPSDEMRRKRAGWSESLAALMASQPASCQIHFFRIWSSVLPVAQTLSPWITGLNIAMAQEDDIGEILKGTIEVGQRSLTRCALPVS